MLKRLCFIFACAPLVLSAIPHWYGKTPTNPAYFYGSGSGDSKEVAKQKALSDLASSIAVHVASETTSDTTRVNKTLDKRSSQRIQLVVDSIKFVNVQSDKQECTHHTCYTRLKLNKDMFLSLLAKRYTNLYNTLTPFQPVPGCHGIFIKEKQQIQALLDKMEPMHEILSAYGRAPQSTQFYQDIIKANSPKPKANIIFASHSDQEIADAITGQYARFVQQTNQPGFYTIENKIFESQANGQFHIGLEMNIKDCQHQIIFSKQLSADQRDRGAAIERIKAQVFKQMRNYQQGVGAGTSDVNSDNIEFWSVLLVHLRVLGCALWEEARGA